MNPPNAPNRAIGSKLKTAKAVVKPKKGAITIIRRLLKTTPRPPIRADLSWATHPLITAGTKKDSPAIAITMGMPALSGVRPVKDKVPPLTSIMANHTRGYTTIAIRFLFMDFLLVHSPQYRRV
jgi:hypothetical protein